MAAPVEFRGLTFEKSQNNTILVMGRFVDMRDFDRGSEGYLEGRNNDLRPVSNALGEFA
jgi:hypothetical protein